MPCSTEVTTMSPRIFLLSLADCELNMLCPQLLQNRCCSEVSEFSAKTNMRNSDLSPIRTRNHKPKWTSLITDNVQNARESEHMYVCSANDEIHNDNPAQQDSIPSRHENTVNHCAIVFKSAVRAMTYGKPLSPSQPRTSQKKVKTGFHC